MPTSSREDFVNGLLRLLAVGDRYLKTGGGPGERIGASMRKDRMKKP